MSEEKSIINEITNDLCRDQINAKSRIETLLWILIHAEMGETATRELFMALKKKGYFKGGVKYE